MTGTWGDQLPPIMFEGCTDDSHLEIGFEIRGMHIVCVVGYHSHTLINLINNA